MLTWWPLSPEPEPLRRARPPSPPAGVRRAQPRSMSSGGSPRSGAEGAERLVSLERGEPGASMRRRGLERVGGLRGPRPVLPISRESVRIRTSTVLLFSKRHEKPAMTDQCGAFSQPYGSRWRAPGVLSALEQGGPETWISRLQAGGRVLQVRIPAKGRKNHHGFQLGL